MTATQRNYATIKLLPTQNDKVYIKRYFNIKKIAGVKTLVDNDWGAYATTNPSKLVYSHLVIANTDETTAIDLYIFRKTTFYTKFYELSQAD